MEKRENESSNNNNEPLKSEISIRCAKAALLLSELNSSKLRNLKSAEHNQNEELEAMRREVSDLKIELLRERVRSRAIKVSGIVDFLVLVVVVLLILVFNWMIVFEYY